MRINHYLKENRYSESPSNLLIVDTEANIEHQSDGKQIQTFRLGYAIHLTYNKGDRQWYQADFELHSINDFWELLDKYSYKGSHINLYVIAHNMSYDYTILKIDSYLSSRNLEIKMRVIDSAFIIRTQKITFISSTNYYKQSLKELGIIFELNKMEQPDFENCTDEILMPYCKRDTQVLSHIMKQHIAFLEDNDLGSFQKTIAGQAWTAFRHRFMHGKKLLVHTYEEILQMEKESYRGGRCEAFRIGKFENIHSLDINSMYPFVMKSNKYPTVLKSSSPILNPPIHTLKESIESGHFILADCDLKLKKPAIACKRKKLLFPIGNIRQTITSPEIEYLLDNPYAGIIEKVNRLVIYDSADIFSEYVDFFYNLRQSTNNKAIEAMSKLLLNALYGKFGQHNSTIPTLVTDEKEINMYSDIMKDSNSFEVFVDIGEKYIKLGESIYHIKKEDGDFARDSIPIIASAVTSYARKRLFELMEKAGLENVLYCDTDSLFVNQAGLDNLSSEISQSELGKLKLEKSGTVEIFGAKDYSFNGKVKLKGIKQNSTKLPDGTYLQYQFQTKNIRYRNAIPDGTVILAPIIKHISRKYDKGIVKNDTVFPLAFTEF